MITLLLMALAATPSWQTLAGPFAPAMEKELSQLVVAKKGVVTAVLDQEAAAPQTIEGVATAWKTVIDAMPGLESPNYAGSGEGFNRTALRLAGVKVLRGLITRTAAQLESKKELDRLVSTIDALPDMKPAHREELAGEARHAFRG